MEKVIIQENQRGLLFKNGIYRKLLVPGKYHTFGDSHIEILQTDEMLVSEECSLETLLADPAIAASTAVVEVPDQHLVLHFKDGKFAQVLRMGKFAFWADQHTHEFQLVDISNPIVGEDVPRYIFPRINSRLYTKVEVTEYQQARLYLNQRFERVLEAGTYYFWNTDIRVDVGYVDTRLTQMKITGQELLTQDKVSLRVNFICSYRITDPVRILTEIDDYEEQLHVAAQLALREFVGKHKLDEILENKEEITEYVLHQLREKAPTYFVEIVDGGVRDIILPGEIRDIMNTVLLAEKRAQANVITRREEVASTRSLLNTAKLMDENQTLYRLKELEYMERICGNVESIHLNGGGGVLAQLSDILNSRAAT